MLLELLVSLCCAAQVSDTLDVATVSSNRNTAALSVSPVQSITGSRIERTGTLGLHEIIGQFAGASIRDYGGIGGLKTVSVRNMGATHTAVIYDGIHISDVQNGQVDISRFDLDDIGSISLSIGQEDNIFCSARHLGSAGTLRIESTGPSFASGPTGLNARMTFGSFGTYMPYVGIKQKLGSKYALKASIDGTVTKGDYPFVLKNGQISTVERRINSDMKSFGAEADFYADWNSKGRLKGKINWHSSERGLPGSVVLYTQNAYERLWDRAVISNIMYDCDFGKQWKFHADAGFTGSFDRHLDTDPIYTEPQDSRYAQNEYSLSARSLYTPVPELQIAAAEDLFFNTLSSNIPECSFPVRTSSISALSVLYEGRKIKASASIAGTYVRETSAAVSTPPDRFRLSPIIGISWHFHKSMRLRASYKNGFRVPTFNDLYYARVGNLNLRPESADQFNLGMTYTGTFDWGTADITVDTYYNSIKDKIVAVPTMFIWKMHNVGKAAMYGTDMTLSMLWKASGWLKVQASANYSLQYATDITDPDSKNYRHQLPYTPRHSGSGNIIFQTKWVNVSDRITSSGKRYSNSQNLPDNEIAGYADHNISINREFTFGKVNDCKIYISLECMNLSDNNYQIIHYYPMPGRSFRLTMKFKY